MIINFDINKKITIEDLWNNEHMLSEIESSSDNDRALILVSTIIIEEKILEILSCLLPKIKSITGNSDFTFSFKIDLLKSYDFCNPKIIEYSHLLRKIRNNYAHSLVSLDTENKSLEKYKIHLDKCINEIDSEKKNADWSLKVITLTKWLLWELYSLVPYAKKLREIIESEYSIQELKKEINSR